MLRLGVCQVTVLLQTGRYTGRRLHGSAPPYLAGYFTPVSSIEGRSQLRSAAAGLLLVPRTWTVTIGPRAFTVSSPAMWNSLPAGLRDPSISLSSFRKKLKTYLFNTPTWLSCLIIHLIIFTHNLIHNLTLSCELLAAFETFFEKHLIIIIIIIIYVKLQKIVGSFEQPNNYNWKLIWIWEHSMVFRFVFSLWRICTNVYKIVIFSNLTLTPMSR